MLQGFSNICKRLCFAKFDFFPNRIFILHDRKGWMMSGMSVSRTYVPGISSLLTNASAMHDALTVFNDFICPVYDYAVLAFFFLGSAALSSSLPFPSSASAISSSLPLLSCAESYSSATSESESDWKSSSRLSSSSSAEPRSARAATTSSSEELMSASLSAAWIRAED